MGGRRDDPALGFSEWASLAYLSSLPGAEGLAPHFLGGGDVAGGIFVMEDLGEASNLDQLLVLPEVREAPVFAAAWAAMCAFRALAVLTWIGWSGSGPGTARRKRSSPSNWERPLNEPACIEVSVRLVFSERVDE